MRLTFDESDLKPILTKVACDRLDIAIKTDDWLDLAWDEDADGKVTGVSIEFEVTGPATKKGTSSD